MIKAGASRRRRSACPRSAAGRFAPVRNSDHDGAIFRPVDSLEHALREEAALPDSAVVVRGGALARPAVEMALQTSWQRFEVLCLSVCAHASLTAEELWIQTPTLAHYRQVRISNAGTLRARGFVLVPTFKAPHYSLVMPEVDIYKALDESFSQQLYR
jgi:hypothetical protein